MAKNFSNLLIVWIFRTNPFWMLSLDFVPDPVSKIRVEFTIWMETITSFNHVLGITSFDNFSLENFLSWEIIINDIKVFEFVSLVDDFLINSGKILGSLSGKSSDSLISVQPSPTRTDFKTVKEIIHVGVSDI